MLVSRQGRRRRRGASRQRHRGEGKEGRGRSHGALRRDGIGGDAGAAAVDDADDVRFGQRQVPLQETVDGDDEDGAVFVVVHVEDEGEDADGRVGKLRLTEKVDLPPFYIGWWNTVAQ